MQYFMKFWNTKKIASIFNVTDCPICIPNSLCKVCLKRWSYLRVLIENNNYMHSCTGFFPSTIVGEVSHTNRRLYALLARRLL